MFPILCTNCQEASAPPKEGWMTFHDISWIARNRSSLILADGMDSTKHKKVKCNLHLGVSGAKLVGWAWGLVASCCIWSSFPIKKCSKGWNHERLRPSAKWRNDAFLMHHVQLLPETNKTFTETLNTHWKCSSGNLKQSRFKFEDPSQAVVWPQSYSLPTKGLQRLCFHQGKKHQNQHN